MLISASLAFAVSGRTTYQAKIIKPNGYPLESSYVNFRFTVLDPAASCAIYVEDYTGINMTSSGGMISFALGAGVVSFPASATSTTFATTFDNSVNSFSCQTPGIYNPSPTDARKIVMQFNDGSGWQTLPAMTINAVPYAMYASKSFDSKSLNGKSDAAFVEKINVPTCASDRMLYFNGASFSCVTYSAGSTGISSVTTSGSVLVTGGSASAPVISITAATMSQDGYLTAIDYAEFKSKLSASSTQIVSTLGYAPVSGAAALAQIEAAATSSATADTLVKRNSSGNVTFNDVYANAAKLNYVDIYRPSTSFNIRLQAPTSLSSNYILNLPTTSGTTGQVLSTDGVGNLSWINAATGSVTSVSGTASEIVSSGGSTPTLGLANTGTAGTYFKVTTDSKGRVTSGVTSIILSDLPASVLNTTSNFSGDISGMISNITVNRIQGVSVTVSSLSNNDILQYDGSKYVNKNIPSCSGNYYLTFNGTNFSCAFDSGASGTITTLSVTGPISSTGGANPTLSMAQADASTNGYLSSADFNTFNNKQNATSAAIIATLGYTPADSAVSGTYAQKANNLSDLTNIITARTNLGLGSLAVGNSVDLGSASATGIIADARLTTQLNVTSGAQYTKVTVDSKGRVTSGAQLSSSDVTTALGYTPSNSTSGVTSLNGLVTQTQIFSVGVAGTNFGINSSGSNHTFNIPLAASSSVTAGLLSNADYTIFNDKQNATSAAIIATLGYTPADSAASGTYAQKANNLSDLTNIITARTNLGLGGFATASTVDLSTASATGILAVARLPAFFGDATVAAASNTIIFSNTGVTAGTYTKLTVDSKGRVTSSSALSSADVTTALGYTPADIAASGTYAQKANNLSDLTNIITARTNLGLGSLAVGNSVDLGSASATGIIADARLANQANVTSGTQYTKVTVDGKGRVTSGAQLASIDVTTALGYTPANNAASGTYAQKANNLSDLTNIITARTNLGLGSLAVGNSIDLGSASATGTIAIARLPAFFGDATVAAASNTIIFSNTGVTAGTYTKVSVDSKGRVTSSAALSSSDVTTALGYTPANAISATQWVSSGTAISYNSGAVGIGALEPSTSAVLEVSSTTKGFLPPRLTSVQRDAVPTPVMGLMIFNTTSSQFEFYTGSSWAVVGGIAAGAIAAFETATCPNGWAEYTAARGRFLRAIDNGAGIDPSGTRAPGSAQTENWRGFSMTNTGQNTTAYSHGPVDMGKSTSTFVGNMFTGAWSAPAAAIGLRWNASDETRPTNIAVTYCRFLGGTGSPPVGANQISQIDSSVTVADAGSGTISLAIDGVERVRVQPTGNVGIGTTTPAAKLEVEGSFIRTIARASGNGVDGLDSGQVVSRVLNITKLKTATSLRIGWTDGRRSLNGGCRWEIRVNGASCPGAALVYDHHSQAGSDPHISGHIVGYCDGLSAGSHQIQIWVSSTPGYTGIDCYTGWSGSRWMLESEEVN